MGPRFHRPCHELALGLTCTSVVSACVSGAGFGLKRKRMPNRPKPIFVEGAGYVFMCLHSIDKQNRSKAKARHPATPDPTRKLIMEVSISLAPSSSGTRTVSLDVHRAATRCTLPGNRHQVPLHPTYWCSGLGFGNRQSTLAHGTLVLVLEAGSLRGKLSPRFVAER